MKRMKIIIFIFALIFIFFLLSKTIFAADMSNNEISSSTVSEESSTLNETVTDTTTVDDGTVIVPEVTVGDILIIVSLAFLCGISIISICVNFIR